MVIDIPEACLDEITDNDHRAEAREALKNLHKKLIEFESEDADSSHSIFIGRDFGTTKSYSEETAATIDEEVKHIFDQAYAKCEALLREHADLLTGLAEYLLIHETIEGDDFRYYCEHGQMPIHPDDTIEPPAKVIRRMDEAPVAPQPEAEAPAQPTDENVSDRGDMSDSGDAQL